jgi:hypothetical protein
MSQSEFIKNKTKILYRGQEYTIKGVKKMNINGVEVTLLRLPHKKYNILVNADNVVKC